MHKLIFLQKNDEIISLYSLTCHLFCDIVQFHVIDSPNPKDFFLKHEKVINLFYSLREKYKDDPSCSNSFFYYILSVFSKHSYIGEIMNMAHRELDHTKNSSKPPLLLSIIFHPSFHWHWTFYFPYHSNSPLLTQTLRTSTNLMVQTLSEFAPQLYLQIKCLLQSIHSRPSKISSYWFQIF